MAYATWQEVQDRWPGKTFTTAEQSSATVLLDDAEVEIDAACPLGDSLTTAQLSARKIVSARMVKRAMASPGGVGVESTQQGSGPFQLTAQYSNPTGDLYLTKADRRLLGCGGQRAATVSMFTEPDCSYHPELVVEVDESSGS